MTKDKDLLKHIGTPKHSGRYPWGSGEEPYQRGTPFLGNVKALHRQGLSDNEIAKLNGMNSTQLRQRKTIERELNWLDKSAMATRLKEKT